MRSIHAIFATALFSLALIHCKSKEETSASNDWKEMDDFHMVMAETFHPFKDSADLNPTKTRATELKAAAEAWAKAPLPEKVNNDEMKAHLAELHAETGALEDMVKNGDDAAIGDQLTKVHDKFHHIQEIWYGGHDDHHADEKHEGH